MDFMILWEFNSGDLFSFGSLRFDLWGFIHPDLTNPHKSKRRFIINEPGENKFL